MARKVNDIFETMRSAAIAEATSVGNADAVAMFNNTSKVALWRILFYAFAYCVWTFEVLFDDFIATVVNILALQRPHTLRWYRQKALAFQLGFNLLTDSDKFDNTGYTDAQVTDSKIVRYAAINEATIDGKRTLLLKIAKEMNGEPSTLSLVEEDAFTAYMQEVKDAGNILIIYNRQADVIRAAVNVYYNPLLLDGNGNRLDGGAGKPVEDAAKAYPFSLDFNGEFILAAFVDALQNAYGVSRRRCDLIQFEKKTGDNAFQSVGSSFVPEAGYAKFDTDGLTINYIPDENG